MYTESIAVNMLPALILWCFPVHFEFSRLRLIIYRATRISSLHTLSDGEYIVTVLLMPGTTSKVSHSCICVFLSQTNNTAPRMASNVAIYMVVFAVQVVTIVWGFPCFCPRSLGGPSNKN